MLVKRRCEGCGVDITRSRKARQDHLCDTCRWSKEVRGRTLVHYDNCDCECARHPPLMNTMDDGACGDAVNRHVPVCCYDDPRPRCKLCNIPMPFDMVSKIDGEFCVACENETQGMIDGL